MDSEDKEEIMEPLKNYKEELNKYRITLEITAGCGNRSQSYIDDAYVKVQEAWSKLSQQEKNDNPLPTKETCEDDGTGDIASGISTLRENDGCTIV